MNIYEIDVSIEGKINGEDVDLSVMEILDTDQGFFLTGYNHLSNKGFVHQILEDIPEMEGVNFSAARRNMTDDVVARIVGDAEKERLEFHSDIDRTELVRGYLKEINNGHNAGPAISLSMMSQYGQISPEERENTILRHTTKNILASLETTYPEGPKSTEQLKAEGKTRNRDPFMTNMGVIDLDRGTVTSANVAQLDH